MYPSLPTPTSPPLHERSEEINWDLHRTIIEKSFKKTVGWDARLATLASGTLAILATALAALTTYLARHLVGKPRFVLGSIALSGTATLATALFAFRCFNISKVLPKIVEEELNRHRSVAKEVKKKKQWGEVQGYLNEKHVEFNPQELYILFFQRFEAPTYENFIQTHTLDAVQHLVTKQKEELKKQLLELIPERGLHALQRAVTTFEISSPELKEVFQKVQLPSTYSNFCTQHGKEALIYLSDPAPYLQDFLTDMKNDDDRKLYDTLVDGGHIPAPLQNIIRTYRQDGKDAEPPYRNLELQNVRRLEYQCSLVRSELNNETNKLHSKIKDLKKKLEQARGLESMRARLAELPEGEKPVLPKKELEEEKERLERQIEEYKKRGQPKKKLLEEISKLESEMPYREATILAIKAEIAEKEQVRGGARALRALPPGSDYRKELEQLRESLAGLELTPERLERLKREEEKLLSEQFSIQRAALGLQHINAQLAYYEKQALEQQIRSTETMGASVDFLQAQINEAQDLLVEKLTKPDPELDTLELQLEEAKEAMKLASEQIEQEMQTRLREAIIKYQTENPKFYLNN